MDLKDIFLIPAAYFLGAVPFAYIVVRAIKHIDIRTVGSGNVGATNVARVLGRKWAVTVFILDVLKGFAPVLAAQWVHGRGLTSPDVPLGVVLVGLAAIAGHNWPVYLGFKGGKGMATSCGVFLGIFPLGTAVTLAVWAVMAAATRYVSVASMAAAVALLGCAIVLQKDPFAGGWRLTAFAGLATVLAIVRHRSNIGRLMQGKESKIGAPKNGIETQQRIRRE